jgi:hypothetical protein
MNTREAIVINTLADNQPVLDFDPIELEIDVDKDIANAFADEVMRIWETVTEAEMELPISPLTVTYSIVWSDTRTRVQFLCPVCDDVCDLDDGATEDLPDNRCAMVCASCLDG